MDYWQRLGIAPTRDRAAIRRAYVERMKTPPGSGTRDWLEELRVAYRNALAQAGDEPAVAGGLADSSAREAWGRSVMGRVRWLWLLLVLLLAALVWIASTPGARVQLPSLPPPGPEGVPFETALRNLFRLRLPPRPGSSREEMDRWVDRIADLEYRHFPSGPPPDASIEVYYVIESNGVVSLARISESGYGHPAFEQAVASHFRQLRFAPDESHGTSRFHYRYAPQRRPRPEASVLEQLKQRRADFDAVYRRHRILELPAGTQVAMEFRIEPDGRVSSAKLRSPQLATPAFEQELAAILRRERFPANPRFLSTQHVYQADLVVPPVERARPISDINAMEAQLNASFRKVQLRFFGNKRLPPGAALTARYIVEPGGSVSDAYIVSSGFRSPAFEQAILDVLRSMQYAPRPQVAPTRFAVQLGDPEIRQEPMRPGASVSPD